MSTPDRIKTRCQEILEGLPANQAMVINLPNNGQANLFKEELYNQAFLKFKRAGYVAARVSGKVVKVWISGLV